MKKILGLDLGSTSIGWAFVLEEDLQSTILGAGVRIVSLTSDEVGDFQKGKAVSINKDRTMKRGARRNIQRYKQRRDALIRTFKAIGFISPDFTLSREHNLNTHYAYAVRAQAATEEISKEELVRVLLMLNKKRGYKSSRKDVVTEEGNEEHELSFDEMEIAKKLYVENLTPGQYALGILQKGGEMPSFYASDLFNEIKRIVQFQQSVNAQLPANMLDEIQKKSRNATYYYFDKVLNISIAENKGNKEEKKIQSLVWRTEALTQKVDARVLAYVIGEINDQISKASSYLGKISDNSKELLVNKLTVGQFQYKALLENPNNSQKNVIFKRSDYLNEFEKIWETQKNYHPELTDELKRKIRDITIFYQRKLKSQKHLVSLCELERLNKVAPKSSPVFQCFRMWQNVNNLKAKKYLLIDDAEREGIIEILSCNGTLTDKELLKYLGLNPTEHELNFDKINGDRTRTSIINALVKEWEKLGNSRKKLGTPLLQKDVVKVLLDLGLPADLLDLNFNLGNNEFDKQKYYQLWHLLYSLEDDNYVKKALINKFGFTETIAHAFLKIKFETNYSSLSVKAMRKIIPQLMKGIEYSEARDLVYETKIATTEVNTTKEKLELVKKNSLRNPVVEKVLNQTINLVNAIIASNKYGRPDEIRIELARELKASNAERSKTTKDIKDATKRNVEIRKTLLSDFNMSRVTKNDIIRYKCWEETGKISIYTGKPIKASDLFNGDKYDIDHIIPQSRLFDDSFSNKTLCERDLNIEKSNQTAYSFLKQKLSAAEFEQFIARVSDLAKAGKINKPKFRNLNTSNENIPENFINRQLNETQYIAKKAKDMLKEICSNVWSTSGSITARLRDDWGLNDIMKELNFEKYKSVGLTYEEFAKNGERILRIKDWSKRNDHRHHAMDAITIALTRQSHVQYLNNLNANFYGKVQDNIESKITERINGKTIIKKPIINIREEFIRVIESILISHKTKNKVVTKNKNKIKAKNGSTIIQDTLTPRGQLHKDTFYGTAQIYEATYTTINAKMDARVVAKVACKRERDALTARLEQFGGDPKKAFSGKNSPANNPIFLDENKKYPLSEKVKIVEIVPQFTTRMNVGPELNEKRIEKVIDVEVRRKLMERFVMYDRVPEKAFSNLDNDPIYLDRAKKL
jgi:CRISPR-associated endonuclease Csn1